MLKFLVLFGMFALTAMAQATAQTMTLAEIEKSYGNYQVSCESMVLAVPVSDDPESIYDLKQLPFEQARCREVLQPTEINDVLGPFFREMVDLQQVRTSKSRIVNTVRRMVEARRQKNMVKTLHRNALKMAEACKASAADRGSKETVMCYFGAPTAKSTQPFKVIFQLMLENSLPNMETLCSDDPLAVASASEKPFRDMLSDGTSLMSWDKLVTKLQADGFKCREDACHRNFMGILLPKGKLLDELLAMDGISQFALIPRQIEVYRGEWRRLGHRGCLTNANGKEVTDCEGPANGVKKGICLSKEDGHTWGMLVYGLNDLRNK
jgi:hypothetical protein